MENPWGRSAASESPVRLGGAPLKLSDRLRNSFGRTKDVAAVGMETTKEKSKEAAMKVKEGTSKGINWIKLKYAITKEKLLQKKNKDNIHRIGYDNY